MVCTKTRMSRPDKSVTVCPTSCMLHIDNPHQRRTTKDGPLSKKRAISGAFCMLNARATSSEPLAEHDMMMCMGLESVISQAITEHVLQTKRLHVNRILAEQDCQRKFQDFSELNLPAISFISSRESKTRSFKIAVQLMGLGQS
jgi:hypothetical protein